MLCWNVYYGDVNAKEIKVFNIFDHWAFYDACLKAKRKYKDDKAGFEKEVRLNLHYYFWSKCEWEIVLEHWPDGEWSDLRTKVKVSEMVDMFRSAGKSSNSWRIGDQVMDKEVTLRVYPEWYQYHDRKIDVCEQIENNWDIFIGWLWDHRKELKARK